MFFAPKPEKLDEKKGLPGRGDSELGKLHFLGEAGLISGVWVYLSLKKASIKKCLVSRSRTPLMEVKVNLNFLQRHSRKLILMVEPAKKGPSRGKGKHRPKPPFLFIPC